MTNQVLPEFERRRVMLQGQLDAQKEQAERNRMGQFSTPNALAIDILRYAKGQLVKNEKIRFIDPAIGTGSFYSAFLKAFSKNRISTVVGYEVDPHYGLPTAQLWKDTSLEVRLGDFTRAESPPKAERFNLLICNPPYVRHHHITGDEKRRLKLCVQRACGIEINGLAGLYCYFLGLSHAWMTDGGLAGWLIPSEFMNVNYGSSIRRYLLSKVTLLHIHRFDPNDVQFNDALVSSVVVWFRKTSAPTKHEVRFTYGGSLKHPKLERFIPVETLARDPKWTRYPGKAGFNETNVPVLGDFFKIKRGLATGNNQYFILTPEEIERRKLPSETFRPILPSPRYLPDDEIIADTNGNPVLDRHLFLLDCQLDQAQIKEQYPTLWAYLKEGERQGIAKRYLCRHRTPWYLQENRPPAPFVCTYLGRGNVKSGRPFRFILNNSRATAANVYLMLYPKEFLEHALAEDPTLKRRIWEFLNGIDPELVLSEGRVYGGGLHKLEPRELSKVPATNLVELFPGLAKSRRERQSKLFATV